jgi:hypothetical protein
MKKIIRTFIIIMIFSLAGWIWWNFYYTYSEGNRGGLLQKFSYKGNIFKTYEGELVLNSITIGGNVTPYSSEKFYFSVQDEKLGKQMNLYEGKRVLVHYSQKHGTLPWRGETPYIVDSIVLSPNP